MAEIPQKPRREERQSEFEHQLASIARAIVLEEELRAEEERHGEEERPEEKSPEEKNRIEHRRLDLEYQLAEIARKKLLEEERWAEEDRLEEERQAEKDRLEQQRLSNERRLVARALEWQRRWKEEQVNEARAVPQQLNETDRFARFAPMATVMAKEEELRREEERQAEVRSRQLDEEKQSAADAEERRQLDIERRKTGLRELMKHNVDRMDEGEYLGFNPLNLLPGFSQTAYFISSDPDQTLTIYKRFKQLSARNLLFLEGRVAALQREQDSFDLDDVVDANLDEPLESFDAIHSAMSWEDFAVGGGQKSEAYIPPRLLAKWEQQKENFWVKQKEREPTSKRRSPADLEYRWEIALAIKDALKEYRKRPRTL
jgi:hypothetical protein